jgi:hypothetical protein
MREISFFVKNDQIYFFLIISNSFTRFAFIGIKHKRILFNGYFVLVSELLVLCFVSLNSSEEVLSLELLLFSISKHLVFDVSEILSLLLVSDTCENTGLWYKVDVTVGSLDEAFKHWGNIRVL